jgi:hypothetical protein
MTFTAGGSEELPAFFGDYLILSIMKRAGGSHMRGPALIWANLSEKLR